MMNNIERHILFCGAYALLFSVYSYLLDLSFFSRDYGSIEGYSGSVSSYLVYFFLGHFPWTIIAPVVYNVITNNAVVYGKHTWLVRLLFGALSGLIIGWLINRAVVSFYTGSFRSTKNLLLFPMIGISVELIRLIKVKMRNKKSKERPAIESAN